MHIEYGCNRIFIPEGTRGGRVTPFEFLGNFEEYVTHYALLRQELKEKNVRYNLGASITDRG
jgi:hypothetical protein